MNVRELQEEIIVGTYSLTHMQKGILFYMLSQKQHGVYFEQVLLEIDGYVDGVKLERETYTAGGGPQGSMMEISFVKDDDTHIIGKNAKVSGFNISITNNTLSFSQRLSNNSTLNIHSANGKLIYSSKVFGSNHKLPKIAKGVYLLRITEGAKNAVLFKDKVLF
jgi:hypothetical protein